MRGTRWLLLVAIVAIIFGVGVTYRKQKNTIRKNALPAQQPMPPNVLSTYEASSLVHKDQKTGCIVYDIDSKDMRQSADSSHVELTGVKLRLYHKAENQCDAKFDLVESAAATYFADEARLYSEGDVQITLGEPGDGEAPRSLIGIKSSGVNFDGATGRAETDRSATFQFKNGDGHSIGALYDPPTKELLMKHDVVVDWKPVGPNAKPVHIEAPSLQYHESTSQIDLIPTGRMTRGEAVFAGEVPAIHLRDDGEGHKSIRSIDANHAHCVDVLPGRKLTCSADKVYVEYNDEGVVQKITAEGNAVLNSVSEGSQTDITARLVELFFDAKGKESLLSRVSCNGNAVITSKPLPVPGRQLSETHIMRGESIQMKMSADGRELENVSSHPPATVEFQPNLPAQHHRTLHGDDMLITYGPRNRIDSFRAVNVKTSTDPNADELKRNRTVSVTASREMVAHFDPQTGQMASMEQSGDFTYQEGTRKARASKAGYDARQNVMTLDTGAAVSDATGSTTADRIRLDEKTDDFTAEGNVNSTRLPDKSQKGNSAMFTPDAPLQAQARKMESTNRNHHTRYEGGARLWQGANRVSADVVEIDRDKHTLVADGNVVTEAWEQPKPDEKKKTTSPAVLTLVHAPHLLYTDTDRLAYYSGGVQLDRPEMRLKSKELRAWLADSGGDSRLDKAFADGAVEIAGKHLENSYTGSSEHAEFYTTEQKVTLNGELLTTEPRVIMNGGKPHFVRTLKGQATTTNPQELTYYLSDGKLVTTGAATDRIPSKKK